MELEKMYIKVPYEGENLKDFILKIFNNKSIVNALACCDTFEDPEFTKPISTGFKYRSFYALLCICNTYFECSEKELAKVIIDLTINNTFTSGYCRDIRRLVLYRRNPNSMPYKYFGYNAWWYYISDITCFEDIKNKALIILKDDYTYEKIYELAEIPFPENFYTKEIFIRI